MRLPAVLLVLIPLTASAAHAWQVFVGVTSETTFRGSTETTSAANREERAGQDERNRRHASESGSRTGGASAGTQCINDDECYGYCDGQRCVDWAPEPPASAQPPSPVEPGPAPPKAPLLKCVSTDQCPQGQSCTNGQCLSPPPPPPSSSLWKRGSELYLRQRIVQLRQDLALGEGPVISTLATTQGVSTAKLGRAMRAHRSELIAVMGDGSDPRWTSRFLVQLEALCVNPVSVSVR